MTYQGHIENGKIVLDSAPVLTDGMQVVVTIVEKPAEPKEREIPTLYERMKPIIGIAKHLPPDASTKIDEVLYGRTDS